MPDSQRHIFKRYIINNGKISTFYRFKGLKRNHGYFIHNFSVKALRVPLSIGLSTREKEGRKKGPERIMRKKQGGKRKEEGERSRMRNKEATGWRRRKKGGRNKKEELRREKEGKGRKRKHKEKEGGKGGRRRNKEGEIGRRRSGGRRRKKKEGGRRWEKEEDLGVNDITPTIPSQRKKEKH